MPIRFVSSFFVPERNERKGRKMKNTLFYIGGTKGGVGKSFVAMALIDYLFMECRGKKQVMLIETDFNQPDVAKMYSKKIPTETIVLDETENAWLKLGRVIYENQDKLMVMNTAKGNAGINRYGKIFVESLEEYGINLVVFWPMNRQVDSVDHLLDFLKVIDYGLVFPIRNNYFSPPEDFVILNERLTKGKDKQLFLSRFSMDDILDFPSLNDLFCLKMYSERIAIEDIPEKLVFFEKAMFNSWRGKVHEMFDSTGVFSDETEEGEEEKTE
jgi:hypothetical protein